jgi:hypothetical protein
VLILKAFISALTKYPEQSYQQLLNTVRDEMKGKYSQKPQLSACHREWSCLYERDHPCSSSLADKVAIDVSLRFVA